MKYCIKCDTNKEDLNFYINKKSKDGLYTYCKECHNLLKKSNYVINIERNKNYYQKNKLLLKNKYNYVKKCSKRIYTEDMAIKRKEYYIKNKEKIITQNSKYKRNRKKFDIPYKISDNLRTRLYLAIKNGQKTGSAIRDLGCSIEELKIYLESKFHPNMTWDNYGKWHIDHVKPLSKFNLIDFEELKKACHYTNLQPLWAIDNLKKGNKE
jgi:hypothetical protein